MKHAIDINYVKLGPHQIRLLEFEPPNNDPELRLRLRQPVDIDDTGSYRALSYTWNDDAPPNEVLAVTIDDIRTELSPSLISFLLHYRQRYPNNLKPLWIDAVCIDQRSNGEKTRQLPLMGQVYQKAELTIVWLGATVEDLTPALKVLEEGCQALGPGLAFGSPDLDSLNGWLNEENNLAMLEVYLHFRVYLQ